MVNKSIAKVLALMLILFFNACKKDFNPDSVAVEKGSIQNGPIPAYVFDWETATYMPSADAQVPMPWNSGTTAIDPTLASDHKKVDGWRLVWNTFSPTQSITNSQITLFFSLYNINNGLLRFYLWQPPKGIATTYVDHGLSLYTNSVSSQLLNFNVQEISDPLTNQAKFKQIARQQLNANGGTWYIFTYEIAYDPNVVNTTFPNFGIEWNSQYVNVNTLQINGSSQGAITGTIGTTAPAGFGFGNILQGFQSFAGGLNYAAAADTSEWKKAVKNALTAASQGVVKGLLNVVLGLGGSTAQPVKLSINATYNLNGNIVTNGGLLNMKLVIPGQANVTTADGNVPDYTQNMGIFNLSGRPTVNLLNDGYEADDYWSSNPDIVPRVSIYRLNVPSVNMIFNPAVINSSPTGAHIENLKRQLVLIPKPPHAYIYWGDMILTGELFFNQLGTIEQLQNQDIMVSAGTNASTEQLNIYSSTIPSSLIDKVAVRVSFDVVPNSGTGRSYKIAHTFLANVVR